MTEQDPKGAVLGVDPGTKRIGFAISDDLRLTVRPLEVWNRRNPKEDLAHVQELVRVHGVTAVVVGVPYRLNGSESEATRRAKNFLQLLREALPNVPIQERDEALTTWEAERRLREQGQKPNRLTIDAHAAAVILEEELGLVSP